MTTKYIGLINVVCCTSSKVNVVMLVQGQTVNTQVVMLQYNINISYVLV